MNPHVAFQTDNLRRIELNRWAGQQKRFPPVLVAAVMKCLELDPGICWKGLSPLSLEFDLISVTTAEGDSMGLRGNIAQANKFADGSGKRAHGCPNKLPGRPPEVAILRNCQIPHR